MRIRLSPCRLRRFLVVLARPAHPASKSGARATGCIFQPMHHSMETDLPGSFNELLPRDTAWQRWIPPSLSRLAIRHGDAVQISSF
jgi:hypothetical protein